MRSSSYSSVSGSMFAEADQEPRSPHRTWSGGTSGSEASGYAILPVLESPTLSPYPSRPQEHLMSTSDPHYKKQRFSISSLASLKPDPDDPVGVWNGAARTQHEAFVPNLILQPQTIFSELFLVFAAYMALKSQNLVQIIAVVLFNIYLVISGLIEVAQRSDVLSKSREQGAWTTSSARAILAILWTIPVVDALFHFAVDWAAWKLYKELGWLAYKKVSADVALRKLYQRYLILSTLLMFALFFATCQAYTLSATRTKITLSALHLPAQYWLVGHSSPFSSTSSPPSSPGEPLASRARN